MWLAQGHRWGPWCRALDRGCIGIYYAYKMPKTHWRWCRGLKLKYVFTKKKFFLWKWSAWYVLSNFIMQEYDYKCIKMYLITLKVFKICWKMFAPITKVNEGESNAPCPSTLEVTYSSVEKSRALMMGIKLYGLWDHVNYWTMAKK
jgi:hypothetical protein